ncbi:TPA: hypothetical protein ACHKA1_005175, partial [Escherichia coli]|nr:hypothetical protein [Escherichia coli]
KNNTSKPPDQQVSHRLSEQQNRFAGGWSHCVTPTTITSVFSRTVVNHKIGTHAGDALQNSCAFLVFTNQGMVCRSIAVSPETRSEHL